MFKNITDLLYFELFIMCRLKGYEVRCSMVCALTNLGGKVYNQTIGDGQGGNEQFENTHKKYI